MLLYQLRLFLKGEFKVYSGANMDRKWENKTPDTDPVLKELYNQLLEQLGTAERSILTTDSTLISNSLSTDIKWSSVAMQLDKIINPNNKSTKKILRRLWLRIKNKQKI